MKKEGSGVVFIASLQLVVSVHEPGGHMDYIFAVAYKHSFVYVLIVTSPPFFVDSLCTSKAMKREYCQVDGVDFQRKTDSLT